MTAYEKYTKRVNEAVTRTRLAANRLEYAAESGTTGDVLRAAEQFRKAKEEQVRITREEEPND